MLHRSCSGSYGRQWEESEFGFPLATVSLRLVNEKKPQRCEPARNPRSIRLYSNLHTHVLFSTLRVVRSFARKTCRGCSMSSGTLRLLRTKYDVKSRVSPLLPSSGSVRAMMERVSTSQQWFVSATKIHVVQTRGFQCLSCSLQTHSVFATNICRQIGHGGNPQWIPCPMTLTLFGQRLKLQVQSLESSPRSFEEVTQQTTASSSQLTLLDRIRPQILTFTHNMAATLLRQNALRTAIRSAAPSTAKRAALASTTFTRGKATLPDLACTIIPRIPMLLEACCLMTDT